MAAQRTNKRTTRKRGRFRGLYKLLSMIIILAVVAAGCIIFFRVNEITAVGQSKYTAEEIIEASGVKMGRNLLLISPRSTANAILSKLPYVDEVNPRRVLPDKVVITVTECVPAAVLRGEGGWWILDAGGKLLELKSGNPGSLTRITGLTPQVPAEGEKLKTESEDILKLESLVGLMEALSGRKLMGKAASIDLSAPGYLTMEYDGRFTVKLPVGGDTDYGQKVRALEATIAQLQLNETGNLDLTREDKVYFNQN